MPCTVFRSRTTFLTCGIGVILLTGLPSLAVGQVAPPATSDPQSDAELRKRLAPLVPSFRASLLGDSVDAQRATLSVIADIPPLIVADTELATALVKFFQRDIKEPDIIALGLRSFGKTRPKPADIEIVSGRFVRSEHTAVRRAAAESLAGVVANSDPKLSVERGEKVDAYFVDVVKLSVPLLGVGIEDKDTATQKSALAGLQSAANILTGLYTIGAPPLDLDAKPVDRAAQFAPFAPVVRAIVAVSPKLASPLRSSDLSTRMAAARSLESVAVLRRAILSSHVPGEPEPTDPFAGGWAFVREGVTAGMTDPNPNMRLAMTEAIESLGDAFEARALLRDATKDRVTFVRWAAARALGQSASAKPDETVVTQDVAALARLVDDADLDVRTAAITALSKFGKAARSATPKLLAAVGRGDIEPRVAAVSALGAIESDAATTIPVLISGLKSDDLRLRRASATGLIRFRAAAKAALPELRRALADGDAELRMAAAEAVLAIELKAPFKEL